MGIRLAKVCKPQQLQPVQKTFLTYILVTVEIPNVLAADVFGTGVFY